MTETDNVAPFDVCGPLPAGVTVLEASAGTGKTFTIAALTARYVAEGIPLEQLLLVTFTRMATGELRDRVRERLVGAERGLTRALAGVAPPTDDDVLNLLARGASADVRTRRHRIARAISAFDAATIATTHGFCQQVLSGLGVAGDVERDVRFIEDQRDLVTEVVDDLYVRRFHRRGDPPFNRAEALRVGYKAVDNPDAALEPRNARHDSDAAMRLRLADAVRHEVEVRKRRAAQLTYDDQLGRLRDTLADPERGAAVARRLRERYRVVLVDEFQDTDPVQWEIMRRAFGQGDTTLVLIGDPKQAIYAFRGADVYAYLEAARAANTRATLAVNWRSDRGLIDAYDAMFGGARLGHEGISYRAVGSAEANQLPRLLDAPVAAPLRVRMLHRADGLIPLTPKGYLTVQPTRDYIAKDLAADVVRLLSSPAQLVARSALGVETRRAGLRPGHIAVLVRRHRDAASIRNALVSAGVPAVINGAGSVFTTPMAQAWLQLLQALERPAAPGPAHTAALTVFLGWSAERVATADDDTWEGVHARLHRWAAVLRRRGVAALTESMTQSEGLAARMLARLDGERDLTDLRHIGQLLHAVANTEQLGPAALTAWLAHRIAEGPGESDAEDRSRRLDSDAEAVQVLTIYRSKGLEFPVVYCPDLWDPGWMPENEPPVFHDADAGDRRTIDVGGPGRGFAAHVERHIAEQRGEDLRLAYVALTRAKHQAVVWWAGSWDSRNSPLCRLLFFRDSDGSVAVTGDSPPADADAAAYFADLEQRAPGSISLERIAGPPSDHPPVRWQGPPAPIAPLSAGAFNRTLDLAWRRTSYSTIIAGAYEPRVTSEPEETPMVDAGLEAGAPASPAPTGPPPPDTEESRLRSATLPLATMTGGVDFGTLVHGVLEGTDFVAPDLGGELSRLVVQEIARRNVAVADQAALVTGLRAAIETPLGSTVEEIRLRDIGAGDRRNEVDFELPLVGGEKPVGRLPLESIGALLRHHLPAHDRLAGYASRLDDPALEGDLRGYLTGSLDLVLRTRNVGGVQRFAVVDYKTNWLGVDGETLSSWHYRPDALTAVMQRSHYVLQALLYTVALHRYLRWRLADYDPARNLSGALYLFLRGMSGPATPRVDGQPCGVFAWSPPASLVVALSDLLDTGVPA